MPIKNRIQSILRLFSGGLRKLALFLKKIVGMQETIDPVTRKVVEEYPALWQLFFIFIGGSFIGTMFLGPAFVISNWFLILLGLCILAHLDQALEVLVPQEEEVKV